MNRRLIRLPAWLPTAAGIALAAALLGIATGRLPQPAWPRLTLTNDRQDGDHRAADDADATMKRASRLIRNAKQRAGIGTGGDGAADASGLIGDELTPLVTTIGSLESKQLSASPAWPRVLAAQLIAAGVARGSIVAASCSGSFPALNLALACACRALGARLVAVSSVTSSTWGANQPGFTWPEMEVRLVQAGILAPASVAVSTGGEDDRATGLEPDGRRLAEQIADRAAAALGATRLRPASYEESVSLRLVTFDRVAGGQAIAVYVNIGGSQPSIGRSPAILGRQSGWIDRQAFGRSLDEGVMAQMAQRGIRVLHLLNIRDLAVRWGILETAR